MTTSAIPSQVEPIQAADLSTLRLAMVAHRFQKNDGQGRVNYEVALAALQRGVRLTLVTAHCSDEIACHPNVTVVKVGREGWPTQLAKNLGFAYDSAAWIRSHRHEFDLIQANGFITWEPCDIVAAHFVHTAWMGSRFYPYRGFKPYQLYQRTFSLLNARWEKLAYRSAGKVIAVSDIIAEEVAALGVSRDRIEVILNGVDTEEFRPGPADRAAFGLPEGVPMLVFVGDIRTPRKNLGTLLRALPHLPGVHLAVAGAIDGSPAPEQARSLGIADRVHFLGKTPKVAALMRSVDLFCFPSLYEPFGLVAVEAMAAGLPVVVSRNVGAARSFSDSLAVVDDPENAEALAALVHDLLASPEKRAELAGSALKHVQDVSWSATAETYLRVYQSLRS
ncbi:glycosyltransferase family 4 protein [Silvibacterium sp.]|uniref:glycosyltransferase family 4 protein n=1 Tax=Silvibacterium sp. TaxID=1964179 RepID=UPI0039E326D6